jgi:hypothetical protein
MVVGDGVKGALPVTTKTHSHLTPISRPSHSHLARISLVYFGGNFFFDNFRKNFGRISVPADVKK